MMKVNDAMLVQPPVIQILIGLNKVKRQGGGKGHLLSNGDISKLEKSPVLKLRIVIQVDYILTI